MPSIKIHTPDRQASILHLAVALGVALVVLMCWLLLRNEPPEPVYSRSFEQVIVHWQCQSGHHFQATGSTDAASCPECGKPSAVVYIYECPQHGRIRALLRHSNLDGGQPEVKAIKFDGYQWMDVTSRLTCPVCGRNLHAAASDIFASTAQEKSE
jgi:hypothetical protein